MKFYELICDIKKNVFDKISGMVYSIKFQKYGLPHAHILIIIDANDDPLTNEEYNKLVCA